MAVAARNRAAVRRPLRPGRTTVREMIGRYVVGDAQQALYRSRAAVKSVDATLPAYEFWDRLRRGKAEGYKLGALFAGRIERVVAAWVLGNGVEVRLRDDPTVDPARQTYTDEFLAGFVRGLLDTGEERTDDSDPDRDTTGSLLLNLYRDTLGLGDQWAIVNPDGTLSVPGPDTVTVARDPLDYRRLVTVTVTTKLDEVTIIDEYRADARTLTVRRGEQVLDTATYPNLIGRIPVVHFAHGMSGNEVYGHSIHEQLLPLYDQYDDVLYKMLDGAKLLGNPLLAFVGMEDLSAVINANDPAQADTYTDKDGYTETRPQLNIDSNAVLLVGKGGDAKFVSPPTGFTADTQQALKTLFLLLLDHTGIPEFIWGNELSSARASADTQMVQFVKDITAWQRQIAGPLVRLCKLRLLYGALTDPQLVVGPLQVKWPPALADDREQVRKLVETALLNDLLTRESALRLLALVDNPGAEVVAADAEAADRQAALYPDGDTAQFRGQLAAADADTLLDEEMP